MNSSTRPSKSTRFLAGLATVLLVVSAAFAVLLIVGAVAGFSPTGHEVSTRLTYDKAQLRPIGPTLIPSDSFDLTVHVKHPPHAAYAWAAARDLTYVALLLVGLWLLRGLLRSVRDRDPFTEDNVKRLRALALLILIGFPLARLVASLFEGELASSAGFLHHGLRLSLTGSALIGGLAAFALAEVFAAGVRMRVDLEGTV